MRELWKNTIEKFTADPNDSTVGWHPLNGPFEKNKSFTLKVTNNWINKMKS